MIVAVVVVSPPYQIFVIFIYFEIGDGEEVYQLYIHQAKFDAIYRCLRDTLTLKAMYYQYQVVRFKMIKMNSVRAMHQQKFSSITEEIDCRLLYDCRIVTQY